MARGVWGREWPCSSIPKFLGLNTGIFRTVLDSPRLDFGTVFELSGTKISGFFQAIPGVVFELLSVHVCCFYVLLLKK